MDSNNPDSAILRLMDANLNRCREGLRVLEDSCRFLCNDSAKYLQLRSLRHKLDQITRGHYLHFVQSRQSQQDCGRTIAEALRPNKEAVIYANFRRCEESLRVLEEYAKLFDGAWAAEFKAARFAIYTLEKEILTNER